MNTNKDLTPVDAINRVVQIVGTQTLVANALRALTGHPITQSTVHYWMKGRHPVRAECVLACERLTGGVVTRHDLRPDLYPKNSRRPRTGPSSPSLSGPGVGAP